MCGLYPAYKWRQGDYAAGIVWKCPVNDLDIIIYIFGIRIHCNWYESKQTTPGIQQHSIKGMSEQWLQLCEWIVCVFVSPGMVMSVLVVLLLTVFYEVLKVWRVWLGSSSKLAQPQSRYAAPPSYRSDSSSALDSSPSESSLTPMEHPPTPNTRNRSRSLWNTTRSKQQCDNFS